SEYHSSIQPDAAVNPSTSDGPLVARAGKLVGISTAIFSRSGGSQVIGFAIPANMVRVVVASAKNGGTTVRRPWLGARLQAVTPEIAESLGLKRPAGALVTSVTNGSAAARAGVRIGDLITDIDGLPVEDSNAFEYRFATKMLGGITRLTLLRSGRETIVNVALETAPAGAHDELVIAGRSPFAGARVSNVSPALADDMRIDPSFEGVVILGVTNGTPAQSYGFQRGDI